MKKNLIIIILAILTIGLTSYIVYDKIKEKDDTNKKQDDINNITYSREDFSKVIEEELDYLLSKKSYSELTNEEKTFMLFRLMPSYYSLTSLTTNDLKNVKNSSALREMELEYTDIYDTSDNYSLTNNSLWTLDKSTGIYKQNQINHGILKINAVDFLLDYKNENGKYVLSYNYLFTKNQGDGPSDIKLYYTFDDAKNNSNIIKTFLIEEYYNNNEYTYDTEKLDLDIDSYIKDNYELFKDKLETYNYVFEIHDSKIVLVDFYKN